VPAPGGQQRDAPGERDDCSASADIAERLQRLLLPQLPPQLEGLDVAFSYRSASAGVLSGGDFVDYYSRSSGALAFAIGDVAGKGVEAMAVTFVTKYILRAAVHGGQLSWPTNPGEALQELRTGLLEQPDFGPGSERFVTVLFGLIAPRRGLLQLASAGHPTPFIVRADGVERPLLLTEAAIGVELGAALVPYPTETLAVSRGDVVVLFTDGIAELRDGRGRFFEDEMGAILSACHDKPAADVVARLTAAGEAFSSREPGDDVALLCIRLVADPGVD
jgi:serine phosphatase RsbU (regulator of sigma subunit)